MSWMISFELALSRCTRVSDVVCQLILKEEAKTDQHAGLPLVTGSSQATLCAALLFVLLLRYVICWAR